ncbi:hypothetical protein QQF64_023559 [Cirrhinus molitorella]|uniref:Uncharacterized protein n=1 Tax=Cirrhinus molitorella TaxID=172907 RepID=A0ABR3NJC0_9TELE
MSSTANDEDPWQIETIEESQHHPSQAEEASQDDSNVSVRRSSRLASKSVTSPSICNWPLPKILETLFRNHIPAPTGASHEELFTLLCENIDVQTADSAPPPPFSSKKQVQKRKNIDPPLVPATAAPKRTGGHVGPVPTGNSTVPSSDPVLSALSSIQSSLSDMTTRIQALESGSAPKSTNPASATVRLPLASELQDHDDITQRLFPGGGRGEKCSPCVHRLTFFFPPAAAISQQLRSQIIAGNDTNLVKILLSSEFNDRRIVDCGDVSVMLKDSDPRLLKTLTLAEFNVAFGVYRDVICEVYPSRRAELDTYLAVISDLALSYGGTLFYEYHKSFSAKAAMFIQRFNQRLDWSVVDLTLISRHFTGHQALSCSICGSHAHTPNLCPKSVSLQTSKPGPSFQTVDSKVMPLATPLCYNFNENVSVMPVNVSYVSAFIVHCFESRRMQPSSIKCMVAGIQFHLRCLDPSCLSLLENPSIRLLLNGLKREKPQGKDPRLPFSLTLLQKLITRLREGCFGSYSDLLLESVLLTAFYGFLRGGEFSTRTDSFDPSKDLTISDLSLYTHHFTVFLKHSKTDKNKDGTIIFISETNTEEGKPLSRAWFGSHLRLLCKYCGLPPERYTAHSLRIGAATTAASSTPVSTLKAMGRWTSAAYERYLRPDAQIILEAQKAMSTTLI